MFSAPDSVLGLAFDPAVDLRATLAPLRQGRGDPSHRIDLNSVWKAFRTSEGPVTVQVCVDDDIELRAWGPGAAAGLEIASRWCGHDDDVSSFDPRQHPLVAALYCLRPGPRFGTFGRLFEHLVPAVLGQKVIGKEAKESYRGIARSLAEPAPGPGNLRLPPAPDRLARCGSAFMHRRGVERKRGDLLQSLARRAVSLDRLVDRPTPEAYRALQSINGIGPWTTALVGQTTFGDADAVPIGDYNLPHLVSWNLAGEPRGTDERMLELLAPFAGHRARVLRLLKTGGQHPRRRGPRLARRQDLAW